MHPPDLPVLPGSGPSFPVDYQTFGGKLENPLLKGSGTLSVSGDGAAFRFRGRSRALFSSRVLEKQFDAAAIRNVVTEGRRVQFLAADPRGIPLKRPFVFFARDEAAASAIAALLPTQTDGDYLEHLQFREKLRRLPGAASPWSSATNLLIAVNVAVFLVMAGFLGAGWVEPVMEPYIRYGANNGAATTDGEWWRLLTSMFMHYGALHLALNMWALYQSGHLVERLQGRTLYTICYLGSGLGGGFLSLFMHGDKMWSAGASGAIFGVYGALLGYMVREHQALPRGVFRPMMRSTLTFAGYNLVYGAINPGIDNSAHIGGVLTGFVLGWLTAPPLDMAARSRAMGSRVLIACSFLVAISVAGVTAAPRFDYSVPEELAWEKVTASFNPSRETQLLQSLGDGIAQWRANRDNGPALTELINGQLIPFYEGFLRSIDALQLSPGRRTERMRRSFDEFGRERIESYRHLVLAVTSGDPAEFASYQALNQKAESALSSVQPKS